jgi:hypothetical protein
MSEETPSIEVQASSPEVDAAEPTNGPGALVQIETPSLAPPVEPLDLNALPPGLLQKVDHILHHPEGIAEALRQDAKLWDLSRFAFLVTLAMGASYGVVMGATNWLQGSSFSFGWEFLMMLVTGVKVPVLFLLTLLIVLMPIYVSSSFIGMRASFSQVVALLLATLAVTTVILAGMASVAFFFALTTRSYTFMKLLHVAIFTYAGVMGLACLVHWFKALFGDWATGSRRWLLTGWLVLYMFVGTQLAWVMRPFVGSPGVKYTIFRPVDDNFYENVYESLVILFNEELREDREDAVPPR